MGKRKGNLYCIEVRCLNYSKNFHETELWVNGKECKVGKCPKYAKCPAARPSQLGEWN